MLHRSVSGVASAVLISFGFLASASGPAWASRACLFTNGGANRENNRCDFVSDTSAFFQAGNGCGDKTFLNADGNDPAPDSPVCTSATDFSPKKTAGGQVELQNTTVPGVSGPATYEELKKRVAELVAAAKAGKGKPEIFLYFNDHGSDAKPGRNEGDYRVELWGRSLKMSELKELLADVPDEVKIITMHDHCFAAGMLRALFRKPDGKIRKNACGFATSGDTELGYPGYSPAFLKAARDPKADLDHDGKVSFAEAHQAASRAYGAGRSTPISSSGVFLMDYYRKTMRGGGPGAQGDATTLDCLFDARQFPGIQAMGDMRKLALRTRLQELEIETKQLLRENGMSGAVTSKKILEELDQSDAEYEKVRDRHLAMQERLLQAKTAYVEGFLKQNPAIRERFAEVERIRGELAQVERLGLPAKEKARRAGALATALVGKSAGLRAEVNLRAFGVKDDDPAFLASAGGAVQEAAAAKKDFDKFQRANPTVGQGPVTRMLRNDVAQAVALRKLLKDGSSDEIDGYVSMLECEETPVR